MRKLLLITFCLGLAACAGNRTIDGETSKDWIKIVSSKVDNSDTIKDVCFLFDLSFYPESAYDRVKNNPSSCLEQCCWYSDNNSVDFYFNDGFTKDLQEFGVSRRYYPDHIKIKMKYSSFLNRLSASVSSDIISSDGVVNLDYEEVRGADGILNSKFSEVNAKIYTKEDEQRGADVKKASKTKEPISYKTLSMSGMNRDALLAQAQAEEEKGRAHAEEIANIYTEVSSGEVLDTTTTLQVKTENLQVKGQNAFQKAAENTSQKVEETSADVSQKAEKTAADVKQKAEQTKAVIPATMKANKAKAEDAIYDVQKTAAEENKVVEKSLQDMDVQLDTLTLKQKLAYERKQAVNLLKRFYGDEIDAYLRFLDKSKKQEGQVLLTNDKAWKAKKIGTPIYQIECKVNGKIALLGAEADTPTTDYPIVCGTYIVDLDEKTVEAKDTLAKKIAQKKY